MRTKKKNRQRAIPRRALLREDERKLYYECVPFDHEKDYAPEGYPP